MLISGVNGLNDVSGQVSIFGSCSTCHSSPNIGHRSRDLLLNIGTSDAVRRSPDMPLYTLSCPGNDTRQTMDPGLAMSTGKCADIGKFKVPILRGLAARAPYFHDGQAADLNAVIDFYCFRFGFCVSAQDRADLIAFLNSL
jgi:cytochrome c peroxidase